MIENLTIRMATKEDAAEILDLYSPYVKNTAITFEYEVPTVSEFSQGIINTLNKYPFLVAIENEHIIGYAYASQFKNKAAYDWAVETTIYIKQGRKGNGVGKKLYLALEHILKRQNIINLNACIAYTATDNRYLDHTSINFHQHLGYVKSAHFSKCGYKFGIWYDMIWMEKFIGEHLDFPPKFIPLSEIDL